MQRPRSLKLWARRHRSSPAISLSLSLLNFPHSIYVLCVPGCWPQLEHNASFFFFLLSMYAELGARKEVYAKGTNSQSQCWNMLLSDIVKFCWIIFSLRCYVNVEMVACRKTEQKNSSVFVYPAFFFFFSSPFLSPLSAELCTGLYAPPAPHELLEASSAVLPPPSHRFFFVDCWLWCPLRCKSEHFPWWSYQ